MTRNQSKGEREFLRWWNLLSGMPPPPDPEYEFAKHTVFKRDWRFDFAWKNQMVAVDVRYAIIDI